MLRGVRQQQDELGFSICSRQAAVVRFPNLFVSILIARHFEKPILRDSLSNIQK